MDSISNEYLTNTILRRCFPQARDIQIVECKKTENLENLSSDIIRLAIEFQEGVETHRKKLIIKIPISVAQATRLYCNENAFYHKEKQMFDMMIPRLNKIPIVSKRLPLHYLTIDECTVVMEDLAFQGYKVAGKLKFFDLEESSHIFRAIAAFHAATYKVHRENPHLLRDSTFDRTVAIDVRLAFMKTWNPVICELFRRKNATNMVPKFKAAEELLKKTDEAMYAKVNPTRFKFVALNHGDIRKDNMMLKLSENGQIEDVKLIDFQTCWWSTPAYDFLFYLAFSVRIEVIDEQFDDLVDAYWQHLTEALLQLKCSVDYEKTDFLSDIERLRFIFLIWLPARCAFTCPIEHDKMKTIFTLDDEKTFQLCCESLDDKWFTQSLWGWLQYCEKIKLFDAMGNEAKNQNE